MRKSFLISLLMCFLANVAAAQNPTAVIETTDGGVIINMIPAVLTKDGKAELYLCHYDIGDSEWGDLSKFSILDENLQVKQEFSINKSLLDQYELLEEIQIISGEIGTMEFEPDLLGNESGYILIKDIFGNGYNFLMLAENEIKVFDTESKEIAHMNIPAGYEVPYDDSVYAFLRLGDNIYFKVGLHKDGDSYWEENFIAFYKIDSNGNGVSLVAIAPAAKVSPRAPRKGENVTVTIDPEMINSGCLVQVISASGQTVLESKVPAGQTDLNINTSNFAKGVYVVNVSDNSVTKESAKIIIR